MLIRLCAHFIDNPNHLDKLIAIKGLPDNFFFRWNEKYHGNELISPWEPDVEANIPHSIRHLCTPVEILKVFPPIEKGRDPVVDRTMVIGLRFNYMSEAGQTLWERIENYLERSVPRGELIPKPVLVAPNQKSEFNPHLARRSIRGSLEMRPAEIPSIDLEIKEESSILTNAYPKPKENPAVEAVISQEPSNIFTCDDCGKTFVKKRMLSMHKIGAHRTREKKEKAVV